MLPAVIKRLEGYSFLDESDFADKVYAAWLHKKYYGAGHLREELRRRNVRHEEAARILASFTNEQEFERALAAGRIGKEKRRQLRFKRCGHTRKIFRALTARGFAGNLIIKALNPLGKRLWEVVVLTLFAKADRINLSNRVNVH